MEKYKDVKDDGYRQWMEEIDSLPFLERAVRMRDKILESDELSESDKKYFRECFDYVKGLQVKGKELDTDLLKIHMGIKGYDSQGVQKMDQFIRTLMLLSLCGFQFEYAGKN